jgi:hypothetical protein
VEGAPSQVKTGSSNPYGLLPFATTRAKSANAQRHVTAMTENLRGGSGEPKGAVVRDVMKRSGDLP